MPNPKKELLREVKKEKHANTGDLYRDILIALGWDYPSDIENRVQNPTIPKRVTVQVEFDKEMLFLKNRIIEKYYDNNHGRFQELGRELVHLALTYYILLEKDERLSTCTGVDSFDGYSVNTLNAQYITIGKITSLYAINKNYPKTNVENKSSKSENSQNEKIVLGEIDMPDIKIYAVRSIP